MLTHAFGAKPRFARLTTASRALRAAWGAWTHRMTRGIWRQVTYDLLTRDGALIIFTSRNLYKELLVDRKTLMTTTTRTRTEDFTAVLNVPASPGTVSALFTSAAGVSRWWGPTQGDGEAGGTLVTSFGDHGVNAMRVLEAGPSRLVWESIAPDETRPTGHTKEWLGTTMEFDIVPADTGTELRFRHAGLTPQLECWDSCVAAWTYFMASIETFAKTGTGTPFGS